MPFDLDEARTHLARTPALLDTWLRDLPAPWLEADEGPDTFSPHEVVGHLLHGERTDWITRARTILTEGERTPFPPYDRFAQRVESAHRSTPDLLDDFRAARTENLHTLTSLHLDASTLQRRGTHPSFGAVTLHQLLSAWVVHDLAHIAQIARILAKRLHRDVGPWEQYLRILHS